MQGCKSQIIDYLDKLIDITSGRQKIHYKFLRDQGKLYSMDEYLSPRISTLSSRCKLKDCYNNALLCSIAYSEYIYTEGFYLPKGMFPIDHAFCTNEEGTYVVDPTVHKFNFEVTQWFGVQVPSYIIGTYLMCRDSLRPNVSLLEYYLNSLGKSIGN